MSSLALVEAAKDDESESGDVLWIGAVALMLLGAVYAGQLVINCAGGCMRRMKLRDEKPTRSGESSAYATKSMGTTSMSISSRSGLQDESALGMSSRSGSSNSATSSMTPRSGSHGAAAASSMTPRSGSHGAAAASSMTPRSGSHGAAATSSMTPRSGLRDVTLSMSSRSGRHGTTSMKLSAQLDDGGGNPQVITAMKESTTKDSNSGAGPLSASGGSSTTTRADPEKNLTFRFKNPWNKFQHEHQGKGWTPEQMSMMYKLWKKGTMP
eukprot:Skav227406  [mRNA]  locus=scaffold3215:490010:490813:- [translate_table: standard]